MIKRAEDILATIPTVARRHRYPANRKPKERQGTQCAASPSCTGNPVGRQMCKRHLGRWERHGDPLKCVRRPGRACACDGCRKTR